jgi:chromosome segregation ATPase
MPPQRPSSSDVNKPNFEQSLQEIEQSLQALKARHAQIQSDQQRQQHLQQRLNQTEQELRYHRSSEALQTELKQIRQQLNELEVALESQLFSWNGLREVFWQAVRFGGIGIVIGWVLKSFAS